MMMLHHLLGHSGHGYATTSRLEYGAVRYSFTDPLIDGAATDAKRGTIQKGNLGPEVFVVLLQAIVLSPSLNLPCPAPTSLITVPDLDSSRGRGQVADGGFIFRDLPDSFICLLRLRCAGMQGSALQAQIPKDEEGRESSWRMKRPSFIRTRTRSVPSSHIHM
jgi:hypothetical protein